MALLSFIVKILAKSLKFMQVMASQVARLNLIFPSVYTKTPLSSQYVLYFTSQEERIWTTLMHLNAFRLKARLGISF